MKIYSITIICILVLQSTALFSGTIGFNNNSGDFLWSTDGNWSGGSLPGSGDDVLLDYTGGNIVIDSGVNSVVRNVFGPGYNYTD